MLGHMKKHRIEEVFRKKEEKSEMRDEPMSYHEAMNILLAGESQGAVMLRGLRNREGMTQAELGKMLGIGQTNISKMELGKRSISKNVVKRLAELFKTDYRLFL